MIYRDTSIKIRKADGHWFAKVGRWEVYGYTRQAVVSFAKAYVRDLEKLHFAG
jgi:hypothetical protein